MKKFLLTICFIFTCSLAYASGCNSNTHLLMHFNGTDASTTMDDFDCDGGVDHNGTANDNAQLDTANKEFGTAALLLDGTNDYVNFADDADWDVTASSAGQFIIDCWIYIPNLGADNTIIMQGDLSALVDTAWVFQKGSGDLLNFTMNDTFANEISMNSGTISEDTWTHVAFIKDGTEHGIYINGIQQAHQSTSNTMSSSEQLYVGVTHRSTLGDIRYFNGHIDELRIQNDNSYGTPNSGLTHTFTVPTVEYDTTVGGTNSQVIVVISKFIKTERGYDRIQEKHWYTSKDTGRAI